MKQKARLVSLFLVLAMLFSVVPTIAYTPGSLLPQVKTYRTAFADTKGIWCDANVQTVYEVGLMDGKSAVKFDPKGSLTCAQIIVITARLHELLNGGDGKFAAPGAREEWYQPYLDYLEKLSYQNDDLEDVLWYVADEPYTPCDRYDFVWLLSAVLPDSALKAINFISVLPDIYGDEDVLAFYNAGILTGSDAYGTFNGTTNLNRGQAAAMLARIVDASQRVKFIPKAFSFAKELLGLDPQTTVLTIDGYAVTAELYAYCLCTEIFSYEASSQYDYYDTYAQYWDQYYDDAYADYDSFADYLLQVYGIDVAKECAVQWNVADKGGLTPAEKVASDVLDNLKQIAEVFVHQSDYPLTAAQKSEVASGLENMRSLCFGYSDTFASMLLQASALTDNMSAKYAPAKSELNNYLAQYGYFYGQYLTVSYDIGTEEYYGVTKQEALQQINKIRSMAVSHTSEPDYFEYLGWKYGASSSSLGPTLVSVDGFSGSDQATLKNLAVGSLSQTINMEDPASGIGEYSIFLKADPSQDEDTMSFIGSIPALIQVDSWAQDAKVVTTKVYDGFSVAALAKKYDWLAAAGLAGIN